MTNPIVARIIDPTGKVLCDVTARAAAYTAAMLNPGTGIVVARDSEYLLPAIDAAYPGGIEGLWEDVQGEGFISDKISIHRTLRDLAAPYRDAPWRKPAPPTHIDGQEITCEPGVGIRVGDDRISLAALKALVAQVEGEK